MNRVILEGRVVANPDIRTTQNGKELALFTLAVEREYKNDKGEREADFIMCNASGYHVKFLRDYISKGSPLAIVGRWVVNSTKQADGTWKTYNNCQVLNTFFPVGSGKTQRAEQANGTSIADDIVNAVNNDNDDEVPF